MTDTATLLADLEALKAARRSGAKQITMGNGTSSRTVIYRDDKELGAAIAATQAEIDAMGTAKVRNVVLRSPPYRGW